MIIPQHVNNLIGAMLTTFNEYVRLRVDVGQTSFWEGRESRMVHPIDGATVIKVVSLVDFILQDQELVGYDGEIDMKAYRAADGVESGMFVVSPYFVANNQMSTTPAYTSQITVYSGGSFTPTNADNYRDRLKVVTANATAHRQNIGGSSVAERGLPAGTYYLVFSGGGSGDYVLNVEERP